MQVNIGQAIRLSGTTQFSDPGEPNLGGLVVADALRIFTGARSGTTTMITGVLQDRVVRMSDGHLAFYIRISALGASGAPLEGGIGGGGYPGYIRLRNWPWLAAPNASADTDYRLDGLGVVGPTSVTWETSLEFTFHFEHAISPVALSRFMFVVPPGAVGFAGGTGGTQRTQIVLGDDRWSATIDDCYHPVFR
jgi:hypothetical protein